MEYREREINIINLFWKIAFAWRWCLAIALICMILLPGAMYIKELRAYNASGAGSNEAQSAGENVSKEEQIELAMKSLTEDEKVAVNQAVELAKDYEAAINYVESSPLMKIDAYNEDAKVIEFYVDSDYVSNYNGASKESYTGSVVASYCNLINNGTIAQNVAATGEIGYTTSQIQQLISTSKGDSTGNIITVSVIAPMADEREKIASSIKDIFAGSTDKISQDIGSHSIRVLNEYQVNRFDSDLLSSQKSARERVSSSKTALDNAKKTLKENQISALESIFKAEGITKAKAKQSNSTATSTASASKTQATAQQNVAKPTFNIKYAVIGFIIGILLVALIVALIEIFSKKLKYDYELKDIFGVNPLYAIRRKKEYKGIDAWIYKKSMRRRNNVEESLEHFILDVSLLLKGKGVKRVLITGTKSDALIDPSRKTIVDGLGKEGISVEFGGSVCADRNSLVLADDIKNVLVVEQIGSSHFDDIVKEFETFREHEIEVAGGVVVE